MPLPYPYSPIHYSESLQKGKMITLGPRHLQGLDIREIKTKEAFTIIDKTGSFFRASLKQRSKNSGKAIVYEEMIGTTESPVTITLFCAVLGRQRMLTVIQKATELGICRFIPVVTEHSVQFSGLAHQKSHAWPKQAVRAARQCRRASLPEVRPTIALKNALQDPCFRGADIRVVLDDGIQEISTFGGMSYNSMAMLVGPEGGWSDAERKTLREHDCVSLRLGGRVLRAETAVYAGLVIVQHMFGDMIQSTAVRKPNTEV